MKIAHFVGMDSGQLEQHVNNFLEIYHEGVIEVLYQTTLLPNCEEIEYSVLIVYREDSV
jgi:hypothetical protein